MYKRLVLTCVLVLAISMVGCSGDDGAQGPTGPQGESAKPTVSMVILANSGGLEDTADDIVLSGVFAPGSTIATINVGAATPVLGDIAAYDVALVYSNSSFADEVALGNLLADYVDGGGRVVLAQYSYSLTTPGFVPSGRFALDPYSPVGRADAGVTMGDFDVSSIVSPVHPVFHGIGVEDFSFWSNSNFRDPPLNAWGTVLATDTNGFKLVTINDAETVIATGFFPGNVFNEQGNDSTRQLLANCIAYLAGKL